MMQLHKSLHERQAYSASDVFIIHLIESLEYPVLFACRDARASV